MNNVECAGWVVDGKMQAVTLTKESLRSWRYLCMPGNARTHVRNILGNFTMPAMCRGKDTTGTVLESYSTWIQQNELIHPNPLLKLWPMTPLSKQPTRLISRRYPLINNNRHPVIGTFVYKKSDIVHCVRLLVFPQYCAQKLVENINLAYHFWSHC